MRNTVLSLCAFVAGSAVAQSTPDTKHLQDKLMEDLTSMIQNYDFSNVLTQAQDNTAAHVIEQQKGTKPKVQDLLAQLHDALEDQVSEMWPDAPLKDAEMFEHLQFEFDLHNGQVIAETAAKNNHGLPYYQYAFDTKSENTVEVVTDPVSQPTTQTQSVETATQEAVVDTEPVNTVTTVITTPVSSVIPSAEVQVQEALNR